MSTKSGLVSTFTLPFQREKQEKAQISGPKEEKQEKGPNKWAKRGKNRKKAQISGPKRRKTKKWPKGMGQKERKTQISPTWQA